MGKYILGLIAVAIAFSSAPSFAGMDCVEKCKADSCWGGPQCIDQCKAQCAMLGEDKESDNKKVPEKDAIDSPSKQHAEEMRQEAREDDATVDDDDDVAPQIILNGYVDVSKPPAHAKDFLISTAQAAGSKIPRILKELRFDSDGDGIDDTADTCPDTPAETLVDATGCPVEVSDDEQIGDRTFDSGMNNDFMESTDSGEGCSLAGSTAANPIVFLLITAALLPLMRSRGR